MIRPYYDEDGIQIFHGDCREILPTLVDGSVGLVLTDPPYSEHTHAKQWISKALASNGDARASTKHSELGFDAITDELRAFVCSEFARICQRWTLAFCDLESITSWQLAVQAAGLEYIRTAVWDKVDSAPQFTGDRPASAAEAIVIAHPAGKKMWNGGGRRNVFRHAVNGERGDKPHPTTKPLPLIKELIALFSSKTDLVLDCFMGSGTTLRAAKDLGLKAIGIEIEERYCEIAVRRLQQGVLDFGNAGGGK